MDEDEESVADDEPVASMDLDEDNESEPEPEAVPVARTNLDLEYRDTLRGFVEDFLGLDADEVLGSVVGGFYRTGDKFNMSRLTEIFSVARKFQAKHEGDPAAVLEFIRVFTSTVTEVDELYIYANKDFQPYLLRNAVERDAVYNPPKKAAEVENVCKACGHDRALTWSKQMRSGDEPHTTFLKCLFCGLTVKG